MTYLRFGIRDLLWAMVVVGMAFGWWIGSSTQSDLEQIMLAVSKSTQSKVVVIRWQSDNTIDVTTEGQGSPGSGSLTHHLLRKQNGHWKVIQTSWQLN